MNWAGSANGAELRPAAPTARDMKARGKREARRPWSRKQTHRALKGRNTAVYMSALQA